MQLCSKPKGARGIEPETFSRRGQLLSRPPTTGPCVRGHVVHGESSKRQATPRNTILGHVYVCLSHVMSLCKLVHNQI